MHPNSFMFATARKNDVPLILTLINELAYQLGLASALTIDELQLTESLFDSTKTIEVLLGYQKGEPVSYALFFPEFSSFSGKTALHLEDLYVRPHARAVGLGTEMLRQLAKITLDRGYDRIQWCALRSNVAAVSFYQKLGATPLNDLMLFRLSGERLRHLAVKNSS
jgi:GNAT superfamily N-acetyltransferase